MEDQLNTTAQESERNASRGDIFADASQTVTETTDKGFSDSEAPQEGKPWKNSKNAEDARRRREREADQLQRTLQKTREAAIIEALGGINPYTGEDIKDKRDIDEYLLMKNIESRGGDPVMEYAKYQKEEQKKADDRVARETQQKEWYDNDCRNFLSKYPDVDLDALIEDEDFGSFSEGKVGVKPLADIYGDYLRFTERFEEKAKSRAARLYANGRASPGALSSSEMGAEVFFTPEQVRAMTPEQVSKNYDTIRASMKHW